MIRTDIETMPQFFDSYINAVENVDIVEALGKHADFGNAANIKILQALGNSVYAPGKWTAKDIIQHVIDTERIMSYRALRFARKDATFLPGFDENFFAENTNAGDRNLEDLLEEFAIVRQSSIALFKSFTNEMLAQTGSSVSGPISVLAIGFVIAGHQLHHLDMLRKNYFPLLQQAVNIVDYQAGYQKYFERLNRSWIEKDFKIEPLDERVLSNPEKHIIAAGGRVIFAEFSGQIIGTVALRKLDPVTLEMTKMAVDENYRGIGAGTKLIEAAMAEAEKLKAHSLVLYSNTKYNANAIRLYFKMGFKELPLEPGVYERANIKMEYPLVVI